MDPIYVTFHSAKNRCSNPRNKDFVYYGARGIEFRFTTVEEFREYMGPRPRGFTLERRDTQGHYEPGNVRWASRREQANNTRRNHRVYGKTLAQWSTILGIGEDVLRWRLKEGWPLRRVLVPHTYRRGRGGLKFRSSILLNV